MGCEQGRDEEKPVHRVWVDAFEMAVYQVRNRDFACFLEATGNPAPPQWKDPDLNHPDQPVVSGKLVRSCSVLRLAERHRRAVLPAADRGGMGARRTGGPRGRSLSVGRRASAGAAGVPSPMEWKSQRPAAGRRAGAQPVRHFRSRRERARVVLGLVQQRLLRRFAGAKSVGPRHRRQAGIARRLLASPHQGNAMCGAIQHSTRISVRRLWIQSRRGSVNIRSLTVAALLQSRERKQAVFRKHL